MSRIANRTFLAVAVVLAMPLFTARAEAQVPTTAVTMNFTIPITLRDLDTRITRIRPWCSLRLGTEPVSTGLGLSGNWVLISHLSKSEDGRVAGTITASGSVDVPADAGGKQGAYECVLEGWMDATNATSITGFFAVTAPIPFKVVAADYAAGSFVW